MLLSCLILQDKISTAITKIRELNGQPCLIPRLMLYGDETHPLFNIQPVISLYRVLTHLIKGFGRPNFLSASYINGHSNESKALEKSIKSNAPSKLKYSAWSIMSWIWRMLKPIYLFLCNHFGHYGWFS